MKFACSIISFSLLLGTAQSRGPAIGTACITLCFATCTAATCWTCPGRCADDYLCYDDNTTMETMSGNKKVRDVDQGDHVLTIKDGKEHWSEVTFNVNIPVAATGFIVEALDSLSGEEYELHVTASHSVPSINASEELLVKDAVLRGVNGKDSFARLAKVVAASDLEIGDSIQVMSPNKKDVSLAKITSLKSKNLKSKNVMYTADGTVVSNGVLTATSCDIPMKDTSLKEHMEESAKHNSYYQCVKKSLNKENISRTFSKASVLGLGDGKVYTSDLFEFLLKHCGGIVDIIAELQKTLRLDVSPTAMDKVALLHMIIKKKVKMIDANSDNVIDHIENPSLDEGQTMSAIEMNPYLCENCMHPLDTEKILKSFEAVNKSV